MSLSRPSPPPGMDASSFGIIGTGRAITSKGIPCSTRRLHVSNIPFSMTEDDLRVIFEPFGEIKEAQIISNKRGSKGFGFVTFVHLEDAARAKLNMDGSIINNRQIEVNDALPKNRFTIVPSGNLIKNPKILYQLTRRHTVSFAAPAEPIRQAHPSGQLSPKKLAQSLNTRGTLGDFQPFQLFSADYSWD